jgi:ankyrin repeat protein
LLKKLREIMYNAVQTGDIEKLKTLLATRTENLEELKASLENNNMINQQDTYGRTILHYGVIHNHDAIVQFLLSKEIAIPITPPRHPWCYSKIQC